MSVLAPLYRDPITVLVSSDLRNLGAGLSKVSGAVDNRVVRASDLRVRLDVSLVTYIPGDTVDLYVSTGIGDSKYSAEQGTLLASIVVYATGNPAIWEGALLDVLPSMPITTKFTVVNRCSGALSGTYDHSLVIVPVNFEYV